MYSVLVTDDEPTAVKHIESIIEKKCPDFYVAGRARNGKEALEKTLDIHPDILITDIRMPVMDGIQLSEALYSSGEDTKIIIVSGYSEFGYAQSAIKLGVRDYILKPVVPSELQALLFKLKEELKDKYYQGRKEIIRKLSLGQAPKEGEMEKYFPYALYYAALVRRNGLPPRFSGQRNVEIFSDSNETIFIYGRDECEALYICPKELVDGNDFIRLIEHKVEKEQPQTAYFTAVGTLQPAAGAYEKAVQGPGLRNCLREKQGDPSEGRGRGRMRKGAGSSGGRTVRFGKVLYEIQFLQSKGRDDPAAVQMG